MSTTTAAAAAPATRGGGEIRPGRFLRDPRHYQITVLTALLGYAILGLEASIHLPHVVTIVGTALATQWVLVRRLGAGSFDPRSPLTSALSLSLLLRTNDIGLAALAAVITVAAKFLLRVDGKHVFNPTNFGLAAMLLLTDRAWVSPGQWGSAALLGFLLACVGGMVVHRAARSDVTYAFLASYTALVCGRALWLGDPLAVPFHHLASGAFLIFAFFMISDPRTTPDSRAGRMLFAALVALGAGFVHFVLYQPNGLLWSLVCAAPLVPLINRFLPGRRYEWSRHATHDTRGLTHATHRSTVSIRTPSYARSSTVH